MDEISKRGSGLRPSIAPDSRLFLPSCPRDFFTMRSEKIESERS
jgi:hypothetical protein